MPQTVPHSDGNHEGMGAGSRVALVVGFRPGLENTIASLLEGGGVTVLRLPVLADADRVTNGRIPDLLVTSDRCDPDSILRLVASFGNPRRIRVIVLLAGRDAAPEPIYREAGLRMILPMPVPVEELMRVVQLSG